MRPQVSQIHAVNMRELRRQRCIVQQHRDDDLLLLEGLIRKHVEYTGSALGKRMLEHWSDNVKNFVKVFPHEYKRILRARPAVEKKDMTLTPAPAQAIAVGERAR